MSLKRPFVPKSDVKQWFTTTTTLYLTEKQVTSQIAAQAEKLGRQVMDEVMDTKWWALAIIPNPLSADFFNENLGVQRVFLI